MDIEVPQANMFQYAFSQSHTICESFSKIFKRTTIVQMVT